MNITVRKYEEKEIDERDYPIQKIEETQRTVAIESYSRTKRSVKEKKDNENNPS